MARKPTSRTDRKPDAEARPPVLEWIMGGLGLLMVLGCLGVIAGEILRPAGPPVLEARLEAVRGQSGAWLAEVVVENTGGETVAAAEIEGRLGDETASATLDYVPAQGEEKVVLGFTGDPREGLTLHALGWSEP